MLNNTTVSKLHEMKLSAMALAFQHQGENEDFRELSFEERFGLVVDAEWTSRRNNRLTRLLKNAGFSEPGACLEDIEYHAGEDRKERERTADRNAWVQALRDSLPNTTPTEDGDA